MNDTGVSDPTSFLQWGFPGLAALVGLIVLFWQFKMYTALVKDAEPAKMREAKPMLLIMIIGSLILAAASLYIAADKGFAAKDCARITIDPATTVQNASGSPFRPVSILIDDKPVPASGRHLNLRAEPKGAQQVDIDVEPYVQSRLAEAAKASEVVAMPNAATALDEPQ